MNNVIQNLVPAGAAAAAAGAALGAKPAAAASGAVLGVKPAAAAIDADAFHATLALLSRPVIPAAKVRAAGLPASLAAAPAKAQQALEASITKMIEAGATHAEIVASLAGQLAATVTQTLGVTGGDARATLEAVFATALAPPGDSGTATGSIADRARNLAQRALRLESVARSITGQQPGQPNRIAGNLLDARRAKDIPAQLTTIDPTAPNPGSPLSSVLAAASAGTSPAGPAPAQTSSPQDESLAAGVDTAAVAAFLPPSGVAPARPTAAGDGRTVNLGAKIAIATGGDTTLGRVLARAALAADVRQSAVAPSVASTPSAPPPPASENPSVPAVPSDAALTAFVKSFEAVLGAGAGTENPTADQRDAQPAPAQPLPAAVPHAPDAAAAAAFVPAIAPFTIERTDPAAVSAPPAAPAPADPSAIADQVLRGAFMQNVGTSSEIRLSLVPDSLGDVSVKLVVEAGNVTAHVVADTPEVRDALVAAQPQLAKSLADAGLKLSSFTVDLAGSGFAGFSHQQNGQPQNGGRSHNTTGSADVDDTADEAVLEAIPSFGPSIVARPNAGDYNYLA